ncbi:MAG: NAD-dependent epimerase/dehydratase family protein [Lachnospiraceae bacterium]|nr:NAD-dependent epimerase/dehydratase family protein [Lachnospiraceae bacterium]
MERIIISGAGSYIGKCIMEWFAKKNSSCLIKEMDVQTNSWRDLSFSEIDTIIHVAGIVHIKEKKDMWPLYHSVNCDLTYEIAQKAKKEGVKHFIFMSTKAVYVPNTPYICKDTPADPQKMYGKSKLEAEKKLQTLVDESFKISIVRAPTVYGEGCRGNFPRLVEMSKRIHVFPRLANKRSMIYIWNLCEFLYRIVFYPIPDIILFPQDKEYGGTLKMMEGLWHARGEKYYLSVLMALVVRIILPIKVKSSLHTMFMDSVYDYDMSNYYDYEYCVYSFGEAMKKVIQKG